MRFFVFVAILLILAIVLRGCSEAQQSETQSGEQANEQALVEDEVAANNEVEADAEDDAGSEDSASQQGEDPPRSPNQQFGESLPARSESSASAQEAHPGVEGSPRFATPSEANAFAEGQRRRAKDSAGRGEVSTAYSEVLEAWQALQPHLDNDAARTLSQELMNDLRGYDRQLSKSGVVIRGKPMQIK